MRLIKNGGRSSGRLCFAPMASPRIVLKRGKTQNGFRSKEGGGSSYFEGTSKRQESMGWAADRGIEESRSESGGDEK